MIKFLFSLMLLLVANTASVETDKVPVVLNPVFAGNAGDKERPSRAPAIPVCIYLNNHTFTFETCCIGSSVTIVKNNEEVYTNIVDPSCELTVPESITGTVEIQLVQSGITYWALICI